jgi:hypothetical protein
MGDAIVQGIECRTVALAVTTQKEIILSVLFTVGGGGFGFAHSVFQ